MNVKSVKKIKNLAGKRVLYRVDFNVPLKNGKILEDYKIRRHIPTIQFLLDNECRIIFVTHLGRPRSESDKKVLSTKPIAKKLSEILDKKVSHAGPYKWLEIGTKTSKMKKGEMLMLENIRFEEGEEKNSKELAKKLSQLANIYVNDAFAVDHRSHASVSAIKKYLPSYGGFLLEEEISNLTRIIMPEKPMVLLVGGAKMNTKANLIKKLYKKSTHILIGGALANCFLKAHNYEIGKSMADKESVAIAKKIINKYKNTSSKIILPVDVVVSTENTGEQVRVKDVNNISKSDYIFDIGPKTIFLYSNLIKKANTIAWNGPMGLFERRGFEHGTISMASVIAARSKGKAFGVVGGGETVEALKKSKMESYIDWISTGGGAMLSFLGGEKMPGLKGIIEKFKINIK